MAGHYKIKHVSEDILFNIDIFGDTVVTDDQPQKYSDIDKETKCTFYFSPMINMLVRFIPGPQLQFKQTNVTPCHVV